MRCLCLFGVGVHVLQGGPSGFGIFSLLLLLAEGFPLIHCDQLNSQLKYPKFFPFAESLLAVGYNHEIFNILASEIYWVHPSPELGKGRSLQYRWFSEISLLVQFLFVTNKVGCRFLVSPGVLFPSLSPFPVCVKLCSPGQFSKQTSEIGLFLFSFFFLEISHFSVPALSAKIPPERIE